MSTNHRTAWSRYAVAFAVLAFVALSAACSPVQHSDSATPTPNTDEVERFLETFRSFGGEVLTIDAANPSVSANVSTVGTMAAATATQGNPPCAGFVETMPSMVVRLESTASTLEVAFAGATNSTLVILNEQEQILCDENAPLTNNPTFTISDPAPQLYAIYVGRTNMQQPASGTLTVTAQP